jgi:hypothetical protein
LPSPTAVVAETPTPKGTASVRPSSTQDRPNAPSALTAAAARGGVQLRWQLPPGSNGITVVIYRGDGNGQIMDPIASDIGAERGGYLDASVVAGHRYTYMVRSLNADGQQSDPSAHVQVEVPK